MTTKKKFLFFFISTIICLAISAIIETVCFNYNALFGNKSSEVITYSSSSDHGKTTIHLNDLNQYISKLKIEYITEKDIPYTLKFTEPDLFGAQKKTTINDIFDNSFTSSITNLNKHVSDFTIEYENTESAHLNIGNISVDNAFHFNLTRTTFIFLLLILICSFIYFYRTGFTTKKMHIYFLTICSLVGTMIIVAQPSATFYSFDDQIHFQNTVDLFSFGKPTTYSNGEYHLTEANAPDSAGRNSVNSIEEQHAQNELFNQNDIQFSKDTAFILTYNRIAYLPMSIGYNLSKLLGLPFSACFKIGKLFNLLFYAILVAYAIKTIKFGKRLLSIIALLPTNVFLASEYSYDPAIFIGLSIFIAHLVNLFIDKNTKFDFKTALIMIASISYACFTKAIYVPFLLLTLLVPKDRFNSPKQSRLVKSGLIAISILLASTFILPTVSGSMESDARGGATSVTGQMSSILSNPLDYTILLSNKMVSEFGTEFFSDYNNFAYIYDDYARIYNQLTPNRAMFQLLLIMLLIFVFITDNKGNQLTTKHRLALLSCNLVTVAMIWTALYMTFNPVGSNTINGVQSRYFLPLLFPLLICLQSQNIHNKLKEKTYNTLVLTIIAAINVIIITTSILSVYSY